MQRAAASAAVKEAQSGSDENPPTPKRPRLSNEAASPGAPQSELDAINAALAAEEEKRREAVARQAAEAGETEWVLDVPPAVQYPQQPVVVAVESLDAEDDVLQGGRQSFGNFKRKTKYVSRPVYCRQWSIRANPFQAPQQSSTENGGDGKEDTDMDTTAPESVERQKAKAKTPRLSELTSISGAGGRSLPPKEQPSKKKNKNKKKRKSH